MGKSIRDLTGKRLGRLTVLHSVGSRGRGVIWLCQCICGNKKEIVSGALNRTKKPTRSCGCLEKENNGGYKHGQYRNRRPTPQYALWQRAKARAAKFNLQFSITYKDIIIQERCPLLGVPLVYGSRTQQHHSPSLDKIVASKGYVPGNIWVVSNKANTSKSNLSFEEFETMYLNWKRWRATGYRDPDSPDPDQLLLPFGTL